MKVSFIIFITIAVVIYLASFIEKKIKRRAEDDNVIHMNEERKFKARKFELKIPVKKILFVILALVIIFFAQSCFFTVDQTEYAFLTTFEKPSGAILESGLKFKLPTPIQRVVKFSKETYSLQLGYVEEESSIMNDDESKMITGDENIILADIEIQWKISDPMKYAYNTKDPKVVLQNATSAALRSTIGNALVDEALTDGRTEIMASVRTKLSELIDMYDLGISIVNVNLQDVDLPTEEVDKAFKQVTDAREERSTKVNEANKYKNEKLNQVKGESAAIISKAEAAKTAVIQKARGEVAAFNALYSEFVKNPQITKKRLLIETLTKVYGTSKIVIVNGDGTLTHLPISDFFSTPSEPKEAK